MQRPALDLSVYFIVDGALCPLPQGLDRVKRALDGGVTVVQWRHKQANQRDFLQQGALLRQVLAQAQVPLLINDRVEAVRELDADGLHIGQEDCAPDVARAELGADAWLGLSVHTLAQLKCVDPRYVDYIGIGPVYATATKPDHARPLGLAGFEELCGQSPVPVVAIGGIKTHHVESIFHAGGRGVAVISAISAASDPYQAAATFVQIAKGVDHQRSTTPP
jgi:thiamine-phosphate pyrophosphorylase